MCVCVRACVRACVRVSVLANYYIRLLDHLNINNIRTEIALITVEVLKRMNIGYISS